MTDQARVDWLLSYLQRHANDPKRPTTDAYQPSLYDALGDDDDQDQEPKITGHPFRPHPLQPEVCGYQRRDGWACGYREAEHAERPEGAAEEVTSSEQ